MFDVRIVDIGMTSKGGRQTAYFTQLNSADVLWHVKRTLAGIVSSIPALSIV